MEQNDKVYEYEMNGAKYRFFAGSDTLAKQYREYALLYFQDTLSGKFSESDLQGPELVSVSDTLTLH